MSSPRGPCTLAEGAQALTAFSQGPYTPELDIRISKGLAQFAVDPGPGQRCRGVYARLCFCTLNKGGLCLSTSRKDMECRCL